MYNTVQHDLSALTGLLAGLPISRGSISGTDSLSHVPSFRTGYGTQPAILPPFFSLLEVNLTAGFHPIPNSGISGAITIFHFVRCKGIIAIYIHSNEIHNVVALVKCLLVLRCQLYMFRTVTVHPQELLCRYCMCRIRYVVRNALPDTSSWYNVVRAGYGTC